MSVFLLEIGSEEIPARMQAAAAEQLAKRFKVACATAGLTHGDITADATPRRLWLRAENIAAASAATTEELKGPRADAPSQAIEGFLKKTGLTRDQLEARDTGKGEILFAVINRQGRPATEILSGIIPQIITAFDWPKSMRWGAASTSTASPRWVRPLTHIVALLDDKIVPAEVHTLTTGRTTKGHRIHAPAPLEIDSAQSWETQLKAAHVIASSATRQNIIQTRATELAAAANLNLIPDEALLAENANLTEWPVPMLGHFNPNFLAVPREVIQLTMRTNQKYFALTHPDGTLAPAFLSIANMDATDGGAAIIAGNQRVLSARLSDAKFFWDQDLATIKAGGLDAFLPKLNNIVFHEKLGTIADKTTRIAALARWLIESGAIPTSISSPLAGEVGLGAAEPGEGAPTAKPPQTQTKTPTPLAQSPTLPVAPGSSRGLNTATSAIPISPPILPPIPTSAYAALAERAARLCKADLVSATVGEFPEVQGTAGGYLARAANEPPEIAAALRDHYKPTGQGDEIPTAPVTVAVALADKLDTLCSFFEIDEMPTGSRDPFALRRASLGILSLIVERPIDVKQVVEAWLGQPDHTRVLSEEEKKRRSLVSKITDFLHTRLAVQQIETGIGHDIVAASADWDSALDGRLDRVLQRSKALQSFLVTAEGRNLLAAYKRASNILKAEEAKDGPHEADNIKTQSLIEPAEKGFAVALMISASAAASAIETEDFTAAMAALATLRAPIDQFFTDLMVNAPDPAIRKNRLALLASFRDAVHTVADFSRIEG